MKGFRKLLIVLVLLTCSRMAILSQDSTMIQIKDNTWKTAEHTSKGYIEYITFGVSIMAFLVAISTLYYSKRTKELQEKTERNTRRISLKHERTILREMSWSLLKAFNNLTTIEKVTQMVLTPAKINFIRMKLDISELHIYDSFDYELDSEGLQLLYKLHSLIKNYNCLLDRRCDQSEYRTIKYNNNSRLFRLSDLNDSLASERFGVWMANRKLKYIYFSEEKYFIRNILETIDKLYPFLFGLDEIKYDDTIERKIDLTKNSNAIFESLQNSAIIPYSENYACRSGVTLDSCKNILNMEDADKYYALLFVYYYNRVRPKLEAIYYQANKEKEEYITRFHHIPAEMSEEHFYEFKENGLLDIKKQMYSESHRLPVIDTYIEEVLMLIDSEVDKVYTSIENRDIFITETYTIEHNDEEKKVSYVEYSKNFSKENFIDLYDTSSQTLYLYVDRKHFEGIVLGKILHYNYFVEENNLPLLFKHVNGQIAYTEGINNKNFKLCIDYYNKEKKLPYLKNEIKHLVLTYIANGCNDSVTIKTKRIKIAPVKGEYKWKATITFDGIENFTRR